MKICSQTVSWSPNTKFWGNPSGFVIKAYMAVDDKEVLATRNYCENRKCQHTTDDMPFGR